MKLTPREREVLAHWLRGKMNKKIAYDLDLSPETVRSTCAECTASSVRHGREAWSYVMGNVARKFAEPPEGHIGFLDDDIIERIVGEIAGDQDNQADSYAYRSLDLDDLRKAKSDPLGQFIAYFEGLSGHPKPADFTMDRLDKFHGDIGAFHYQACVDFRAVDGDFTKFRFLGGGSHQPIIRGGRDGDDLLIANHPFRPLADELSSPDFSNPLMHRGGESRKMAIRQSLTAIPERPRCKQSVAQHCSNLNRLNGTRLWPGSMAESSHRMPEGCCWGGWIAASG